MITAACWKQHTLHILLAATRLQAAKSYISYV